MTQHLLIKNGLVITGADIEVRRADLIIRDGRIAEIGDNLSCPEALTTIDSTDKLITPGFIHTHIHLCQTLFRGSADDLELLDWLRLLVWPLEAAHNAASLAA